MIVTATSTRVCLAALVVVACVLVTGCVSTVGGSAVRAQRSGPANVAPLDESMLDDVMLSIGNVNGIMGASTMKFTSEVKEMTDHSSAVSDTDCLGAIYAAEEPVYAGSGWTAMRDKVAREPSDDNQHWAEQSAVLYSSADRAQQFFDQSTASWKKCAGNAVTVDDGSSSFLWQLDDVATDDETISQATTQEDADGWGCQHAMAAVSNLTVETWACSYSIVDEAATMAGDMVANAAKK